MIGSDKKGNMTSRTFSEVDHQIPNLKIAFAHRNPPVVGEDLR